MKKIDKLKEMLAAQDQLNSEIAGKNWPTGITKDGKQINWGRTIHMEVAEFIDSFPWKHWKSIDAKADILNAQIELVDIWHFLMSATLETFCIGADKESVDEKVIHESAEYLLKIEDSFENTCSRLESFDYEMTIRQAEEMISFGVGYSFAGYDFEQKLVYLGGMLGIFLILSKHAVKTDIYTIYDGKRILNKFRQDHGYKTGDYKKIWNFSNQKMEDNMVMVALIGSCDIKDLYSKLEEVYVNGK